MKSFDTFRNVYSSYKQLRVRPEFLTNTPTSLLPDVAFHRSFSNCCIVCNALYLQKMTRACTMKQCATLPMIHMTDESPHNLLQLKILYNDE